ncbi:uncharacterized protein LOC110052907 [Orbicella faveolata]|uniref:uncharacterized protein LOC110052907 n=1 Tax=Orbicella faveolata TaxID=48498 RepID=UPI0009E54B80|nr:uncharacterized protein LOC110052907 [Orbicella faveolata]
MAVNNAAIILLSILAFSNTLALRNPIDYRECKKASQSDISSVDIEPFQKDARGRYIFKKGSNVTATVKFTPKVMVKEATVHLYVILGRMIEMKVPYPNACEHHNIKCPLEPNVEYTMIGTIEVMKNLPSLPFIVQLDVELPDKTYLYCFQMLVHIM